MKILIKALLGFILLTSQAIGSVSFDRAQVLLERLSNIVGIGAVLVYSDDGSINAAAIGGGVIVVNRGLLHAVRNDAEMAFILGHELGHMAHGDPRSSKKAEYAADKYAFILVQQAGYNGCIAARTLRGMVGGDDHPDGIDRYHALGCK